ncbi:septation protein SepH [Bifidobacterium margollesii]|nr:septation protein SepH [Bifidobacterium margollesii]
MSNETLKVAHFEHVSSSGDLVFSADGRRFVVRVDDRLEQGILESRQIREENEGAPDPQASATIPISTIQSLIRAGFSTKEVSEQYDVSEVLVRRFARPVETEKKYAIEQFLSARAPGASRGRDVSDMIESSLASARLTSDSLQWKATRHGRDPWHIHASFTAAGRMLKAEWAWDMRDNSVTPLNSLSSKLLKASTLMGDDDFLENKFGPFPMISNAATPTSEPASQFSPSGVQNMDIPGDSTGPNTDSAREADGGTPVDGATGNPAATDDGHDRTHPNADWLYGSKGRPSGTQHPDPEPLVKTDRPGSPSKEGPADGNDRQHDDKHRKTRRSAVPSWDEILFGE